MFLRSIIVDVSLVVCTVYPCTRLNCAFVSHSYLHKHHTRAFSILLDVSFLMKHCKPFLSTIQHNTIRIF